MHLFRPNAQNVTNETSGLAQITRNVSVTSYTLHSSDVALPGRQRHFFFKSFATNYFHQPSFTLNNVLHCMIQSALMNAILFSENKPATSANAFLYSAVLRQTTSTKFNDILTPCTHG